MDPTAPDPNNPPVAPIEPPIAPAPSIDPIPPLTAPPPNAPSPENKGGLGKTIAIITAVILLVLIGAALAYGGYYYGTHFAKQKDTSTDQNFVVSTPSPKESPIEASASPAANKVSAGLKMLTFSPYTITLAQGWTKNHESNIVQSMDKLTLTKGQYTLVISQAAGGGGSCIFPNQSPQPLAQIFTSSADIGTQYKRGTTNGTTFTVCEKSPTGFAYPTSFGNITYTMPKTPDVLTLAEMDAMVASIAK